MKNRAIILAAGFGTRMQEYTKETPKPMLPLKSKPMIEYTIRQLAAHNIKEIAINLHYLADKIVHYLGDGSQFGVKLTYLYEDSPSGTAGGMKKLAEFCSQAPHIIVIYGDIITDLDYSDFISQHIASDKIATICVHKRQKSNSIIDFNQQMQITSFIERPDEETLQKFQSGIWVNSAIYCFKPSILSYIKPQIIQDFPKDIFPQLIPLGELFAYKLLAKRYAIDSKEKYHEAEEDFLNFKFNF